MAAAARKTNWFAIWVSAAVVVILIVVAVFVVIGNNSVNDPGTAPDASNIDAETGAIAVGEGSESMATYIDFMCPVCGTFEEQYGASIEGLVDDGTITLDLHPISILDSRSQGTEFSTRSANAMYCVAAADPDASLPFLQAMFQNQPTEGTEGLTDDAMLEIASGVGVSGIDSCVTDGEYSKFVTAMTDKTPVAPGSAGIGTPTIAINGEAIANSDLPAPAELGNLFQ